MHHKGLRGIPEAEWRVSEQEDGEKAPEISAMSGYSATHRVALFLVKCKARRDRFQREPQMI